MTACFNQIQQCGCSPFVKESIAKTALDLLVITGVALAAIGIIALLAHHYHLPQPLSHFDKLSLDWCFSLITGGVAWIFVASCGLVFIQRLTKTEPEEDSVESEEAKAMSSSLSETKEALFAFQQLENPQDEKYYYNKKTKQILSVEDPKPLKEDRVAIVKLKKGYLYKKKILLEKGVSKHAYKEEIVNGKKGKKCIRTLEVNPPHDHEKRVQQLLREKKTQYTAKLIDVIDIKKGSIKKRHYILEYYPHETYSKKHKNLSEKQKIQIFIDALHGLEELHDLGYLHLDLHRNNIFLTEEDRGRVADFGNARRIEAISSPQQFEALMEEARAGKWTSNRSLLAPEFLGNIGNKQVIEEMTGKADVWGLACAFVDTFEETKDFAPYKTIKAVQKQYPTKSKNKKGESVKKFAPHHWIKQTAYDYSEALVASYNEIPVPKDKESLQYLMWQMLHPIPQLRPNAKEAAEKLEKLILEK